MSRRYGWLLIILLAAAFLRLASISDAPPGLTHDEADHGLDAWGVVEGIRPIYFTVGYGREPLYDYSTAALMSFMGPSHLAGRLTSAYFSLILIAAAYAWVRRAFDEQTALLTAAGLAVSFWAVMTGRQALRSITLPVVLTLAMAFYWTAIKQRKPVPKLADLGYFKRLYMHPLFNYAGAGLLLGLTLYTYIPARITWMIIPIFILFLAAADRQWFSITWRGSVLTLLIALVTSLPLIIFLANNPGVEVRLDQLSEPLTNAFRGDFKLLFENIISGLGSLVFKGDENWRYNIASRPLLSIVMSILFIVGLVLAVWILTTGLRQRRVRDRAGAVFFSLVWLGVGLIPVLITGADLSIPRAIALQPVIYVFPALALGAVADTNVLGKRMSRALAVLLFGLLFAQTFRLYFSIWIKEPEVRVQYESSLITALDYLEGGDGQAAAVSTTTPEQFHSPAVAFLKLGEEAASIRWFNGEHALVFPDSLTSSIIFSGFAPLNAFLEPYFEGSFEAVLPSLEADIDQPLTLYSMAGPSFAQSSFQQFSDDFADPDLSGKPIQFANFVELVGYDLQTPQIFPGGNVRVATLWKVHKPLDEAVLFTQALGTDGLPAAQDDRLDVPGRYWHEGDYFIQLHQFQIPQDLDGGSYPLITGVYTRDGLQRLKASIGGRAIGDHVRLTTLSVEDNG